MKNYVGNPMENCGRWFVFPEEQDILREYGYETFEDWDAIFDIVLEHNPTPWDTVDMEDRIKWAEFVRALNARDFAVGDEFTLNGVSFEVKGI